MSFAEITKLHDEASKMYQTDVQNAYTKGKQDIKIKMIYSLGDVHMPAHLLYGFNAAQIQAVSRFIRSF